MTFEEECRNSANAVIAALATVNRDYSSKLGEIAETFGMLLRGNWDCSTSFEDGTPDIRLIQEDEFDQHLADGPAFNDQLCFAAGHYVFLD